jgi:hypothetical protein
MGGVSDRGTGRGRADPRRQRDDLGVAGDDDLAASVVVAASAGYRPTSPMMSRSTAAASHLERGLLSDDSDQARGSMTLLTTPRSAPSQE